ncbi:hypothetical protein T459_23044 [Capsicum annuum]|uniref:Plastocyanin-like domain-containing protein n=1 Tax=Capsicum annuum TaxID=4072 RepID=A0A2G2YR92_CAPAN|nr:hypothetical protein T459_23044 [Capsicum annuum]
MGAIGIFLVSLMIALCLLHSVSAATRHYKFEIEMQNVTRRCHTKSMVTVNGQFPGPRIVAREGEWFNADTEAIISQALQIGGGPNVSDAYTINGLPGPLYNVNCSTKDTFKLKVKPGKTCLLRLINAALNDELFFSIAIHTLQVQRHRIQFILSSLVPVSSSSSESSSFEDESQFTTIVSDFVYFLLTELVGDMSYQLHSSDS